MKRTLRIPRREWLRGEGSDESYLYREEDGKKCCVGIYLEGCGVPLDELAQVSVANEIEDYVIPVEASWLLEDSDLVERELYSQNDNEDLTEEAREAIIRESFAKHGVEVVYED